MNKIIMIVLSVFLLASAPAMAFNKGGIQVDPNDHAVVTLLWMVYSDLDMCRNSIDRSFMDSVSALGHLNNSRSALRKAQIDPGYNTLIQEIDRRLSRIRFYLVMNERRAVVDRINQLQSVIRNVLGASNSNSAPYYGGYSGGYTMGGGTPVNPAPPRPTEFPVGGSSNPSPVLPSGVVPVR